MPDVLLAALAGAGIGFLGTTFLQRSQFRRADLDLTRERLGITRGLRADLHVAKLVCENTISSNTIFPGTGFPVELWSAQGHRLIAAIRRPAEEILIDAFGRMGMLNRLLSGPAMSQVLEFSTYEGGADLANKLQGMIEKIDAAVEVLDLYEGECEKRALSLLHPFRSRLPHPVGVQ
jgi:hypothetical protein